LHLNMLPLKALPKLLKHASPHGAGASIGNGKLPNGNSKPNGGALASIRYNDRFDSSSQASSSSVLESLEAEEKELKEKLIVLEEQKFIVSEMLADARKRRKFEEMATLSANVDDLSNEIDALRGKVVRLEGDFEGLYGETASP